MDYVDWVQQVLTGAVDAWKVADEHRKNVLGVTVENIGTALNFQMDEFVPAKGTVREAIADALVDLERLGLVEQQSNRSYYKLTQRGREIAQTDMSVLWEDLVNQYLESEQLQVLTKLAEVCQENHGAYVCLRERLLVDIGAQLGAGWDQDRGGRVYYQVRELEQVHLAKLGGGAGFLNAIATYAGIVRVTRQVETEGQSIIRQLLPDWETTNVDFKQEVNLSTPTDKAEFVRDILGLVNTKSSGRRFLLIGFDNNTHAFVKSVDPGITQDRIEDILDSATEPVPIIRYSAVDWETGRVGIIEILRESHKLPYTVKNKMTSKISAGDVYVRHGSHTVKLATSDREYQDLVEEGNKARQ